MMTILALMTISITLLMAVAFIWASFVATRLREERWEELKDRYEGGR